MCARTMPRVGKIALLTYHSLDDSGSVLSTPPALFAEQMRSLRDRNVRVVALADVPRALETAAPSECGVALTFDDGFLNLYEHGLPLLQQYGFPATIFLVTDYVGKTNGWPGQPGSIRPGPLLGWPEARAMSAAGITFGCHTRAHPDLRRIAAREAEEELVASKKAMEDALGQPVETFAYPYGAYDDPVRRLAQAHFALACSARLGFARAGSDRWALERLDMYYLRSPVLFRRLFSPELEAYLHLRRALRVLRGHPGTRGAGG